MSTAGWTRAALQDLVRGRIVYLRDEHGAAVAVPPWLRDAAAEIGEAGSQAAVDSVHPEDRTAIVRVFLECINQPGELHTSQGRMNLGGSWGHYRCAWLNRLDDPDVGGVLCVLELVDGPPITPPELGDPGEHDAVNWMILALDDNGLITDVNGRSTEMLGYSREELVGRAPVELLHPDSVGDSIGLWIRLRQAPGTTASSRRRWLRRDGEEIWLESSYLVQPAADGGTSVLVVVWDITQRLAEERELEESRSRFRRLAHENEALAADFRLLADELPAAVFRCDEAGRVLFHNAHWGDLITGGDEDRLHDVVHPGDRAAIDAALVAATSEGRDRHAVEVRSLDGSRVWRVTLRSVSAATSDHRSVVGSIDDLTDTVALRVRAEHDPLTDLLNRASIEERLGAAIAEDPSGTCVLFCDLDGFKGVNDRHGHEAGDRVLVEISRRLRRVVRPEDAVGRFGGDEFVLVCRNISDVDAVAARVDRAIAAPISFDGGHWRPAVSIGAVRPDPGESVADVLRRADLRMFDEKRARHRSGGHNRARSDARGRVSGSGS
ncbi:MAG: diguanylate cyclase [Actinomycetota bacterium]|nr:diguanylate cyclase [Actinomycetota bacterium]